MDGVTRPDVPPRPDTFTIVWNTDDIDPIPVPPRRFWRGVGFGLLIVAPFWAAVGWWCSRG